MSSSSSRAVVTLREANEYDALLSSSGRNNNNNNNNSRTNRKAPPPSSYGVSSTTTTMEEGGSSSSLHATHVWTQNDENKEEECGSSSDDYSSSHDNNNSHAAAAASSPTRRSKTTCSQWTSFALATLLPLLLIGLSAWLLLIVTRRGATESLFHARYDYIIVGGGPSGIVTATKLARALPQHSILLLESGSLSQSNVLERWRDKRNEQQQQQHASCAAATMQMSTSDVNKFDIPLLWSGVAGSRSRRKVYGMNDVSTPYLWPGPDQILLGRTLGGSGLLNAMIYVRSLRTDWERWNITGWTFDAVLPHYLALERYTDESGSFSSLDKAYNPESSWRGAEGPIHTMAAGYGSDQVAKLFVKAAQEAGFPLATAGFNHPDPGQREGAGFYEFNIRDGKRDSVAQALLGRQPWPPNLQIHTGVTVTRILTEALSPDFVRTNGVAFQTSAGEMGEYLLTDASAELVLAAGAILTPQLLMQSGMGPKGNVLSIPGVGSNCQDHPVVALVQEISPELAGEGPSIYSIGDELDDYQLASAELEEVPLNASTEVLRQHVMERLGTLGTAGFAAGAFLRSPWASDQGPDIQLTVFPRVVEPHVTREQKRQKIRFMHSSAMLVTVALLEADARYVVKSSSPIASEMNWVDFEAPGIDLPPGKSSYLSETDVDRLAWGVTEARRILNTDTMAEQLRGEIIPGRAIDGDRLRGWIQKSVLPNAHWVGTTRMGSSADAMTVVDERLLVRGTLNLRIVDAGVIAGAPNGNVHSTVTVVASRGADMIAQARNDVRD